jgi:hypothetical protein
MPDDVAHPRAQASASASPSWPWSRNHSIGQHRRRDGDSHDQHDQPEVLDVAHRSAAYPADRSHRRTNLAGWLRSSSASGRLPAGRRRARAAATGLCRHRPAGRFLLHKALVVHHHEPAYERVHTDAVLASCMCHWTARSHCTDGAPPTCTPPTPQ